MVQPIPSLRGGILFSLVLSCTCQGASSSSLMGDNTEPRNGSGLALGVGASRSVNCGGWGSSVKQRVRRLQLACASSETMRQIAVDAEGSARKPGRLQLRLRLGAIEL